MFIKNQYEEILFSFGWHFYKKYTYIIDNGWVGKFSYTDESGVV